MRKPEYEARPQAVPPSGSPGASTTERPLWSWLSLGLVAAGLLPIIVTDIVSGALTGPGTLQLLAVPAGFVLAIVALVKRSRPRWPAIVALSSATVSFLVFGVMAAWVFIGFLYVGLTL
ncbi:hypothetical protein [Microbacterium sp. CFBP9034]|uniref:hypothetical protein n=1 Tax=Microbacterium sp. CFBP9034 TaxID=3096540 RepID=UPI002A6A1A6C|nr:hypothetical protein [Microbacterium sp. CFBP9034]MDY0909809.1 hypothetical protein [Microbacterium sp. CFBP9034]